jgi:hypothetical protein
MRKFVLPILACLFACTLVVASAQTSGFLETFDGTPAAPLPYTNPNSWDIFVQGFNQTNADAGIPAMRAQHGPNCEAPGFPYDSTNSHQLRTLADTVFICAGHVMTAPGLAGYAAAYLTPPAVVDFSGGSGTISWQMSTLRTAARDTVDVVITPWSQRSSMAYNNNDQHIPPNNIHVFLAGTNVFLVTQRVNGPLTYDESGQADQRIPGDDSTTWTQVFRRQNPPLDESPSRRDQFEIRLWAANGGPAADRISVCMPGYDSITSPGVFCWVNTTLRQPLDPNIWGGQAAVMFGHRVYNAEKSCTDDKIAEQAIGDIGHSPYGDLHCPPDTWHWDNVNFNPAVPYEIIHSVPSPLEIRSTSPTVVRFAKPAPAGAMLHFTQFGHTPDLQVSFNGGQSWEQARVQPANAPKNGASEENGEAIWTPIPAGVQQIMVRGSNGFWGGFGLVDFNIYGPPNRNLPPAPTAQPTATPIPVTATPVPQAPTSTPIPIPTSSQPTATIPPTWTPEPARTATPVPCEAVANQEGNVVTVLVCPTN